MNTVIIFFCLLFSATIRIQATEDIVFGHLIERTPYMNSLSGLISRNLEPPERLFIENYTPATLEKILNQLNTKNCFLTIYYKASEVENTIFLSGPRATTDYLSETGFQFAETIRKNLAHALSEWPVKDLGEVPFMELPDTGSAHIFIHIPQNIDLERFTITICNFIATTFPSYLKTATDLQSLYTDNDHLNPEIPELTTASASLSETNHSLKNPLVTTTNNSAFDENSLAELSRELAELSQQQNFATGFPVLNNFSSRRRNSEPPTEPALSISSTFSSQNITSTTSSPVSSSVPSLTTITTESSLSTETEQTSIIPGSPFLPKGATFELLPYEETGIEENDPTPPPWLISP